MVKKLVIAVDTRLQWANSTVENTIKKLQRLSVWAINKKLLVNTFACGHLAIGQHWQYLFPQTCELIFKFSNLNFHYESDSLARKKHCSSSFCWIFQNWILFKRRIPNPIDSRNGRRQKKSNEFGSGLVQK